MQRRWLTRALGGMVAAAALQGRVADVRELAS